MIPSGKKKASWIVKNFMENRERKCSFRNVGKLKNRECFSCKREMQPASLALFVDGLGFPICLDCCNQDGLELAFDCRRGIFDVSINDPVHGWIGAETTPDDLQQIILAIVELALEIRKKG